MFTKQLGAAEVVEAKELLVAASAHCWDTTDRFPNPPNWCKLHSSPNIGRGSLPGRIGPANGAACRASLAQATVQSHSAEYRFVALELW
jgi:hypothetical protein